LKKFFVLPALPSNEKNFFDHHNSFNKGPNLAFFSFIESPSNSLLIIKFPKNHITSSYQGDGPIWVPKRIVSLQNCEILHCHPHS
jgi:hypothetical protein